MTTPAPKPSVRVIEELRAEIAHRQELWPHENMMPMNIHRLKQVLAVVDAAELLHDALDKWSVECPDYVADAVCDNHNALAKLSALDATGGGHE